MMKVSSQRQAIPMTYAEYALLPQDRNRYEVLDGELFMTPSPSVRHQVAAFELASILRDHVSRHKLGRVLVAPMDVMLSETNIVQPDILFLRTDRVPPGDADNVRVAPNLIVEVISPSTAKEDREDKRTVYARHGVAHYWIVDPGLRTLEMYSLAGESYELTAEYSGDASAASPLFPGLSIPLTQIWT